MKVGDSVKIKPRVMNSYPYGKEYPMGGWEGRIFDIQKSFKNVIVQIEFDSISMRSMSDEYIRAMIASDTDYACIDVDLKKVSLSAPRDTPEEVKAARKEISEKYGIVSIIDEGDYDIWDRQEDDKKDSDEIALEPEEEGAPTQIMVALCRVNGFLKAMSKIKRKRMITRKRPRKGRS